MEAANWGGGGERRKAAAHRIERVLPFLGVHQVERTELHQARAHRRLVLRLDRPFKRRVGRDARRDRRGAERGESLLLAQRDIAAAAALLARSLESEARLQPAAETGHRRERDEGADVRRRLTERGDHLPTGYTRSTSGVQAERPR